MDLSTTLGSRFSGRRIATLIAAAAALAVASALLVAMVGPISSANPQTEVPGNPSCPAGTIELKIEPVADGTFSDGTLTVTIVVDEANQTFDFTSNIGVDAVIVKGGPNGNLYTFNEATSGTGLHAPVNPANGKFFGLSHISFCYDIETPPTTAPPTTAPPTTAPPTTAPPTTAPPTTAPPTTAPKAPPPPPSGPAAAPSAAVPVQAGARFTG